MADRCNSCPAESESILRRYATYLEQSKRNERGCLLWAGPKNHDRYGVLYRKPYGRGGVLVHRLAWTLNKGHIPHGLKVLHRCDVPGCIAIDHLFLGTQADNMADMWAKGRGRHVCHGKGPKGTAHASAKLNDELVREMRRRHQEGERVCALAREFGIDDSAASRIISRKRWAHVQ